MSIETDLAAALKPLITDRVYFGFVPSDKLPATDEQRLVWRAICIPTQIVTPDNTSCGSSDMDSYRVQIDVYASNYTFVSAMRKPVFDAIEAAFPFAERINDMPDYDHDIKMHKRIIEYSIKAE
ncbi:MAG TPA: DUF3168 domain-containing protein [Burkholderiaceae bacterium]|nr:DUF3168 domain-containing protein [Burkholderiaceae bacterium]